MRPTPADACGIKLTAKTPTPKHVARAAAPGSVLLLGPQDSKLESQLVSSGHTVERAPNVASAKRKSYNVIVADASTADEARASFGDDAVIVRSGDVANDSRQVASRANRRPVRATDRAVIAARVDRPIAAGPKPSEAPKTVVAARLPEATPTPAVTPPPAPTPAPAPAPTPPPTPPRETVAVSTKPSLPETKEPKEPAAPRVQAFARVEVHFNLGGSAVSAGMKTQLDRTARWLTANADARVSVEGHADPTGNPDDNMTLSRARAEAVRDYLASVGVDASRMDVEAFGDTKLKYGARDSRNRRVSVEKK